MFSTRFRLGTLILAGLMITGCEPTPVLGVDQAYINLSPVDGNPSAGYLTIRGGPQDVELLSVTSPYIKRTEIHETVTENGLSKMRGIESINVPAGRTVKLEPGGKHLMLWGVNSGSVSDGKLFFIASFSNGDEFRVPAVIRKMGSSDAGATPLSDK